MSGGSTYNEYVNSINDYSVRPYNSGMIEHDQDLSTIIIYTNKDKNATTDDKTDEDINYLEDLSSNVTSLLSESVASVQSGRDRNPETPGGKIANVRLSSDLDYYGIFNNFSLMAVAEENAEIVKLHQNLGGSWNVFFFGEKPNFYRFTGLFLDSQEYPYYQEFMTAYENYLSGRKCIENNMRMTISYDGKIVEGYLVSISTTRTAESNYKKDFSFTMLVRDSFWIRNNLVAIKGNDGRVTYERRFNGMSNVYRLQNHRLRSGISDMNDNDSSGTNVTNTVRVPSSRGGV
jgi:hypothetical protein